jgi:hypothetical protein
VTLKDVLRRWRARFQGTHDDGSCFIFVFVSSIHFVLVWSPLLLVSYGRRAQVVNVFSRRIGASFNSVAVASSVGDNANRSYPCWFKPPFHMVAY